MEAHGIQRPDLASYSQLLSAGAGAGNLTTDSSPLIRSVSISQLHGRYSYEFSLTANPDIPRLAMFYGDNGSGKTTILRLIWHLLSPAPNRGHRTAVGKVSFRQLRLELANRDVITASRREPDATTYTISIERHGESAQPETSEWHGTTTPRENFSLLDTEELESYLGSVSEDSAQAISNELNRRRFYAYLDALQARPYLLADDRTIYADQLEEPSTPRSRELQSRLYLDQYGRGPANDRSHGALVQELETSLNRVSQYLNQLALGANATGSASANSVYLEVLERLGSPADAPLQDPIETSQALKMEIESLGARSADFERLELVPRFETEAFLRGIDNLSTIDRIQAAQGMLGPYLHSLTARLDALQGAQSLLDIFLEQTNGFLRDKRLRYTPGQGLRVELGNGQPLRVDQLSSGERQLVLLLCNALLARRDSRLFLIDEPELSLNVKWQRKIVGALLACTQGTSLQFILATHSLELLAGHRESVVALRNGEW